MRGGRSEIYRLDIAHQLMARVTNLIGTVYNPIWSPDGQQIAFIGNLNQASDAIYVMDAEGHGLHPLTDTADTNNDFSPTWSPDGRSLIYKSMRYDYMPELAIVDLTSSTSQRLTLNHKFEGSPSWSPDGKHIIYTAGDAPTNNDIHIMDVQNGDSHPLITTPGFDLFPSWSPDGRYILYVSGRRDLKIYLWDILHQQSTLLYTPYTSQQKTLDWSPDGHFILFPISTPDGQAIFKLDVAACLQQPATCGTQRLTMKPGFYIDARWRPT
jgi:TolB protein